MTINVTMGKSFRNKPEDARRERETVFVGLHSRRHPMEFDAGTRISGVSSPGAKEAREARREGMEGGW